MGLVCREVHQGRPRPLAVGFGEEHRAGRDEATAGTESLHPSIIAELPVEMDIDSTESQGHWMYSIGRSSRGADAESTVEERVVRLKSVERPAPFRICAGALEPHVGWSGDGPVPYSILRRPMMVVRQFEEIDLHSWHERD